MQIGKTQNPYAGQAAQKPQKAKPPKPKEPTAPPGGNVENRKPPPEPKKSENQDQGGRKKLDVYA